jgi:hypothetical protein
MTSYAFQCPTCGAPLIPARGVIFLTCPYCKTSVAVPESLRRLAGVDVWTTLVYDAFQSNSHSWHVGEQQSDRFAPLNRSIADGRYRWETCIQVRNSFSPVWLQGYPVADFHLRASIKHVRGTPAGSSYGVIFHILDNENFDSFRIIDTHFFSLSSYRDGVWRTVVDWERTNVIRPYGANQIEVIAQGAHLTFLVNGQVVHERDEEQRARGLVGLVLEGYTVGEEIVYDYLDMTLRAP